MADSETRIHTCICTFFGFLDFGLPLRITANVTELATETSSCEGSMMIPESYILEAAVWRDVVGDAHAVSNDIFRTGQVLSAKDVACDVEASRGCCPFDLPPLLLPMALGRRSLFLWSPKKPLAVVFVVTPDGFCCGLLLLR